MATQITNRKDMKASDFDLVLKTEPLPKKLGYGTLAAIQIISGGSAGFVEICMMHPLDLIKTRFQLQRGPEDPNRYSSILDCVRKMYRTEGGLSFYKGLLPPILVETPKRATKFFTFEQYKHLLSFQTPKISPGTANFITLTIAGMLAGVTEAILVNPFEVVKIQLQADRKVFSQQASAFSKAREIISKDGYGLKGLNKGLTSIMARNGTFNMIYFSFYHNIKTFVLPVDSHTQSAHSNLGPKLLVGFLAGTLASVANIPFDVAKSRIQGPQPKPGKVKYRTCLAAVATIYREEGFFALYKGLLPKVMRLGPGGGIMLVVYEIVHEQLKTFAAGR